MIPPKYDVCSTCTHSAPCTENINSCIKKKKNRFLNVIYIKTNIIRSSLSSPQTAAEYEEKYNYLRKEDYSKFHGYAYDGLWTIALAIKRAQTKLETVYKNTTLQEFEYRDPFWSKLFRDALSETSFIGVTVS